MGALHAISIAKKKGAEVVLLSVLDKHEARTAAFNYCTQSDRCEILGTYEQNIWQDMRRSIEAELENIKDFCGQEGCICTAKIREGSRREEIVAEIRDGGYSLVVMGAFGRSGTSQLGSCLGEITGDIATPVFIVR